MTGLTYGGGWEKIVGPSSSISNDGYTSIFDPVLCELDYSWFTAPGDSILDPFAGGSVRGIVAAKLKRKYTGIDLRAEQISENKKQAEQIVPNEVPEWIVGDSNNMDELVGERKFDHIFTCPPYGDLEVYSDDPSDLSSMSDDDFDITYKKILAKSVEHLNDDRFATIVVGNYRDRNGMLRDLFGLTVDAMEEAGTRYYNDLILITPAASLPMRAGRQFEASRKIGRRHQYVLNFIKGDPKKAVARLEESLEATKRLRKEVAKKNK